MKVCHNCHRENPDDAKFCIHCSFSLEWETEQAVQQSESEDTVIIESAPATADQPLTQPAGVYVGLSATSLAALAGGATACDVRLRNVGALADTYRLTVSGSAATFARISPSDLTLQPGEETSALLNFAAPEEVDSSTTPLDFEVLAASAADARVAATARGTLRLTQPPPPRPVVTMSPASLPGFVVPVAAVGLLLALLGSFVPTGIPKHREFFANEFGGVENFGSSSGWYLARAITGLPVVILVVGAAGGLILAAQGSRRAQLVGSGLLVACAVQAGALYGNAVWNARGVRIAPAFALAFLGALITLAMGFLTYRDVTRGVQRGAFSEWPAWVRKATYFGLGASLIGSVVPFTHDLSKHPAPGSAWQRTEGWAILVSVAIVLVLTRVKQPHIAVAGALVAFGVGNAAIWLRFAAVTRLQVSSASDPKFGAVIGLCGAIAIAVAGAAILSQREGIKDVAAEPLPQL